jgi:adenylate kinase family enzyme
MRESVVRSPKRILIYGVTGAGKSTLARQVGDISKIPVHSVDDLSFEANWVSVELGEQRRRIGEIAAQDEWILDSAYGSWIDLVLPRVELVVCLDYPRLTSLGRVIWRTIRRSITGERVCNGNRESWGKAISKDSIIGWHFKSFRRKRERMRQWATTKTTFQVIRFKFPSEAEIWIRNLKGKTGSVTNRHE